MSLLKVGRYNLKKDWTISHLYVKGILDGYSVEDEVRSVSDKKIYGETAIPYGTYTLGYRQSPKFSSSFLYSDSNNILIDAKDKRLYSGIVDFRPHDLIWVKNIPGFEYVLIHWGNTDDDTDGCLIVGGSLGIFAGQEGVAGSRTYYKTLYHKIYPSIKRGIETIEYVKE